MLIGKYTDYRAFLKGELEKRKQRNLRYSLRAFARDLGVTSQLLSQVFKKKKGFSLDTAAQISSRLGLDEEETVYFCDLVALGRARTPVANDTLGRSVGGGRSNPGP